jgi:hypothetical protein
MPLMLLYDNLCNTFFGLSLDDVGRQDLFLICN